MTIEYACVNNGNYIGMQTMSDDVDGYAANGVRTTTATRNIDDTRKTWKWVIGESVLTEVREMGPGDKCKGGDWEGNNKECVWNI